jgi:hypothetical protein
LVLAGLIAIGTAGSAAAGPPSVQALRTVAVDPLEVDDALELVGWEIVPEALEATWPELRPAARRGLRELRTLRPATTVRLDLHWHGLDLLRQRREVELILLARSVRWSQRFPLGGEAGASQSGSEPLRTGHVLRAAYRLYVPPWAPEEPVELNLQVHYEDPARPPVRVTLGEFRVSAQIGRAVEACALAHSGRGEEARRLIRRLTAEELLPAALARCLRELEDLLEPAELARCRLSERREPEAAALLLRATLQSEASDRGVFALALAELARSAESELRVQEAEALYRWAVRQRPDLISAVVGLQRLGSAAADEAVVALRRAAPHVLSEERWMGPQGPALFRNGSARLSFEAIEGPAELEIAVHGEPAAGGWPRLRARLNGRELGQTEADSTTPRPWPLPAPLRAGSNALEVEFWNDEFRPGADRNAFLGPVTIRFRTPEGS